MADYDIEEAFEAIEKELIDSMMRNLERHKAEEDEEGFNWTMWQVEQLKSLQEYKKRNKDKFGKEFEYINKRIEMFIKGSRRKGQLDQERKILKALKEGKARAKGEPGDVSGNFFRINDRKLNALIKATTDDLKKAETALLRRADDQYRKIIYNAQVYANTGAGTYEKAVDMATKDFLSRGIDCIEYKNGSRHNIKDYARMCLRTAGKRAYLTGEGESRQERGLHLVIINKRGNPCPLCAKWLGKVLIDDVWSGGSKKDGNYPLMSQAVAAGLYHPQCQDVHDTYFDDGFDDWYDSASKEERKEMLDRYNNGQKMNYSKRQAEKYGRLEEYSLDEENKKKYKARKEEWKEKEEKYSAIEYTEDNGGDTYSDILEKCLLEATPNNHKVEDLFEYEVDGNTYKVDNKHVILEYKKREREVAEIIENALGGYIYMVPRVLFPQNVSTPDYLYNGEKYDLKEISSNGEHAIYNRISKMKKQANNCIIDISKNSITEEELKRQIDYVYWSKNTNFIERIIVIRNNKILHIFERNKK